MNTVKKLMGIFALLSISVLFTACPGGDEPETSLNPPVPVDKTDGSNGDKNVVTIGDVSFKMINVEGGTFSMGATSEQGNDARNDEKPVHSVTLSDYMIGETEVTQELWEMVMGINPSKFKGPKKPLTDVTWNDSQKFIKTLNSITGRSFRLPTEAEWEYAARGGKHSKGYKYAGSNNIEDVAWYRDNSWALGEGSIYYGPQDVGGKLPNELGIFDMSGNAKEWCSDIYGAYDSSPQVNPQGVSSGIYHVIRGGCWNGMGAHTCRVSYRLYGMFDDSTGGFRLVE